MSLGERPDRLLVAVLQILTDCKFAKIHRFGGLIKIFGATIGAKDVLKALVLVILP